MLGNGHASRNFQFCGPENSHKSSAFGECISKNIQTNAGRTRRSVFSTLVLLSKWSLQLEIYCCMDLVMHRQISCVAVNLPNIIPFKCTAPGCELVHGFHYMQEAS